VYVDMGLAYNNPVTLTVVTRCRFYETPLRPKSFWAKFQPKTNYWQYRTIVSEVPDWMSLKSRVYKLLLDHDQVLCVNYGRNWFIKSTPAALLSPPEASPWGSRRSSALRVWWVKITGKSRTYLRSTISWEIQFQGRPKTISKAMLTVI
jgi:hypothetical protein